MDKYFEEKYPFGEVEASIEEIEDNLKGASKLITIIKKDFKET